MKNLQHRTPLLRRNDESIVRLRHSSSAVACAVSNLSHSSPSLTIFFFKYLSSRTFIGHMFPHWSNQTTPFFLHFNRRPPLNSRHRCNTGSRTSFTFSLVASFHHRPPFNDRAKYKSTTFHSIGPSSSSYASHTATRQAHKRDKRFSSSQKTWQLAYQWQNLSPFRPRGAGA